MKLFRTLILTLSVSMLISCGGAEERKSVYMEKAKSSMESGDFDKARIELKNVLQIDPKDSEALYNLGRVYEGQKDYRKAFQHYKKAEDLNPELLINRARLGLLYLAMVDGEDKVREIIDFILSKDSSHPEGLLLKAALLVKNKNKEEAFSIGQLILESDPGNTDAVTFVVRLYISDKKYSDAIAVVESALKVHKDSDILNNQLAILLATDEQYDRAEVIFKNFLKKYPDRKSSFDRLASFYDTSGNESAAVETLRASVESDPEDADRYIFLVKYIEKIESREAAISELESAVTKNNNIAKLRTALGELYFLNGDKKSAIEVFEKVVTDFPDDLTGVESRILLATIYVNDQNLLKANEMIADALEISPNDPNVNFLRGKLALIEQDVETVIISLRIVVKEQPERVEAYLLLANAYHTEGNEVQAKEILNNAYDNNKSNAKGLLALARYHMTFDLGKTEKIVDGLINHDASNYEGLSIKALILNQKKQEDEAYELAKKITELYPEAPNGYLQAIPYLTKKTDNSEAISLLETGYITVKDNRKILTLLTSLEVSAEKFDIAEKRIQAELKTLPDDTELKVLLAKVHLSSGDTVKGRQLLTDIVKNKPALEVPYLLLSRSYVGNDENELNKSILEQGNVNVESSYKIALKLGTIYEKANAYDKAITVYRNILKSHPDNLVIINNLIYLLAETSDASADKELIKNLVVKLEASGKPLFLDTIGWVYYKIGDYPKAIDYLNRVVKIAPDINIFNYHLGMAYKMSGDKEQAKIYLEKSLADGKVFKRREEAQVALSELQ